MADRAGTYIMQPTGYKAFFPKPLPPKPQIKPDPAMVLLLSHAERDLARLDGITTVLPNPDLFLAMYVKKEALLSSQIEGTQVSLEGVLEYEAGFSPKEDINEVKEVINYIKAINYCLVRLETLPLSLRLIKEAHKILIEGTRGQHRNPGEFRQNQNWIGPFGGTINDAVFIPPPPNIVLDAMGNLEKFIHLKDVIPTLIKTSLIHAQFETIHPFLDGNSRVGRLLITLYICWKGVIAKPLLYLSFYLKKNREQYYDLLMRIRNEGDWESWIKFFLKGISETSQQAAQTVKDILGLKEACIKKLYDNQIKSIYAIRLIDFLFEQPLIKIKDAVEHLHISREAAHNLVARFNALGILNEVTGKKRYKAYLFQEYVSLIARGTELT